MLGRRKRKIATDSQITIEERKLTQINWFDVKTSNMMRLKQPQRGGMLVATGNARG
jgi:hypothetical protein